MTQPVSPTQIELNYEPGLVERFPTLKDCVRHSIYSNTKAFGQIAADLDQSPSKLSRMLAEADKPDLQKPDDIGFPLRFLGPTIESTRDLSPIYWLIEKFLEDPEIKRKRALDTLSNLMPAIQQALDQAIRADDKPDELKAVK